MNHELACPDCGFNVDPVRDEECLKCGAAIRGAVFQGILEIDIAHSGETWNEAKLKIEVALNQAILHCHRGVKIIHGQGSATGRSSIRERAGPFLRILASHTGSRCVRDKNNPGAHIIWLNR